MKNTLRYAIGAAAVISLGFLSLSCSLDETADIRLVELGTALDDNICLVEAEGGEYGLQVYSNGGYHIELLSEATWLTFNAMNGNGDGIIKLVSERNDEFKRMASFVLCSDVDSRRDTVYVKQKGMVEAALSMDNTTVLVAGAGGATTAALDTNIPFSYFDINVDYTDAGSAEWISSVVMKESGDALEFTTLANTDEESIRSAAVTLSFVDGWGDKVGLELNVIQKNANEQFGVQKSFEEVRTLSSGEITSDIFIEGIVVSNTEGGNAGENEQISASSIDYSGSKRTVYVQSLDGRYGFAVITASEEDNVFKQHDKVQLILKGTELTVYDSPKRYVISGFRKHQVASDVKASESEIFVKEKRFKDLTDDDIYTYVTLTDVEFPIRKGSISPINEGYAAGGNSDRISKFPLLVRDIDGSSFYMYTNTVCTYRNDGSRVPQGSGKLSGVVVHERFSRFEWKNGMDLLDMEDDPELGNIGTYQIRHQTREDIWKDMNMDFKDSFSELLVEYRYWNPDPDKGLLRPTYGDNGWFTHTYQKKYTGSEAEDCTQTDHYNQHLLPEVCFSYLGPMGLSGSMFGANSGNVNGLGIVLDSDKDRYNEEMAEWVGNRGGAKEWLAPEVSDPETGVRVANGGGNAGKSWCAQDCYCSFRSVNWWDFKNGRGHAWMLNFSTKDIASASGLSMQISVLNSSQKFYSPRYWKAEWSEVDSMKPEDDGQWKLIGEYTVPDISQWTGTLFSSVVGYKGIDFTLPSEMLGKENVYIRLMPVSTACSSGADYTDAVMTDDVDGDKHSSSIEYIAIRYNK